MSSSLPVTSRTSISHRGEVHSVQTLALEGASLPEGSALEDLLRELVPAYESWIEVLTAGFVRIERARDGLARARVQPFGPVGIVLGAPTISVSSAGGSASREIISGVLAARRGGTLSLELSRTEGGASASVVLDGFRPRAAFVPLIGRELFLATQDVIHARHSRAFLRREVVPRLRTLDL